MDGKDPALEFYPQEHSRPAVFKRNAQAVRTFQANPDSQRGKKKLLLKAVNCKFEHNQHHIQVVKLMRTLLLGDQKDLDNKHEES